MQKNKQTIFSEYFFIFFSFQPATTFVLSSLSILSRYYRVWIKSQYQFFCVCRNEDKFAPQNNVCALLCHKNITSRVRRKFFNYSQRKIQFCSRAFHKNDLRYFLPIDEVAINAVNRNSVIEYANCFFPSPSQLPASRKWNAPDIEWIEALGVRIMRPALTFISASMKMGKKNCLGSDFKLTIRKIGCVCIEASHVKVEKLFLSSPFRCWCCSKLNWIISIQVNEMEIFYDDQNKIKKSSRKLIEKWKFWNLNDRWILSLNILTGLFVWNKQESWLLSNLSDDLTSKNKENSQTNIFLHVSKDSFWKLWLYLFFCDFLSYIHWVVFSSLFIHRKLNKSTFFIMEISLRFLASYWIYIFYSLNFDDFSYLDFAFINILITCGWWKWTLANPLVIF